MKRTVRIVAGVVTLSVAIGLSLQLWAQNTATQPQTAGAASQMRGSKIAVVNLAKVINKYQKWEAFKADYKKEYTKVFEERVNPLKLKLESLDKEVKNPSTTADRREAATKEMKQLERQMQDIADDAKNILGKKEADQFVQLYREVRDAVAAIARYYSIDVVMHYNDAFEEKDMDTPQNVARKMGHAGCMPLWVAPGSDISDTVIEYLNRAYKPAAAVTPASGTFQQTQPGSH